MTDSTVTSKVGSPLLESFTLEGVNGYKTISARFERNVKILSAENGAGKTTLLNALHALLTFNFEKLLAIHFSRFTLKFAGHEVISRAKSDLFPILDSARLEGGLQHSFIRDLGRYGVSAAEAREMVLQFITSPVHEYPKSTGYKKLAADSSFSLKQFENSLSRNFPVVHSPVVLSLMGDITAKLGGVSVLYLPTFRRIEASLPEVQVQKAQLKPWDDNSDWAADRLIFFGLEDIWQRLEAITNDIRRGTSDAFARISGRTLDQLIEAGDTSSVAMNFDGSEKASLQVVFARLGRHGGTSEKRLLELIDAGKINEPEHQALRNLLAQLLEVYRATREPELALESFVNVVDSYWQHSAAEKRFDFDKNTVNVQVIDTYTQKPLPLSSLSSGEKQIVSVFARLYLDFGKRYLILIDEPELSLSLEWQKKFLPDVFAASSCVQLIAATHSPFTFDNDLDPFAGSLFISYAPKEGE